VFATPSAAARFRGIDAILHFTTNRGLVGILSTGTVLSRAGLDGDKTLEAIGFPNNASRSRDADWVGYVSMSISRVNKHMLSYSQSWHRSAGVWWAVLAFDVSILDTEGVVFASTNNVYPVVRRATGVAGFEAMFAQKVPWGKFGSIRERYNGFPDHYTTCPQAEVLYPNAVPLTALMAIYVPEPEQLDEVRGILAAIPGTPSVPVLCRPEVFD
jgi:hypothetical protein